MTFLACSIAQDISEPTSSIILDINSVLARTEHSIVSHRRLGTRSKALQVLGRGNALAPSEVLQEDIDVTLEASNALSIRWQERENGHLPVGSFEHVPGRASELDALRERDRLAVGAPCAGARSVLLLQEEWGA